MTELHVVEPLDAPVLSPKEELTARLSHFFGNVRIPADTTNDALAKLVVVVISDFIPLTAEYAVAGEEMGDDGPCEWIDTGGLEAPLSELQAVHKATQFYPMGRVVRRFVTDFS